MRFHTSFVSGQYLCFLLSTSSTFAKKNSFLLILLFVFFPCSLSNGKSCERCNEAWFYAIQSAVQLCNDFFKLKHFFLFHH